MNKFLTGILFTLLSLAAGAQPTGPAMADSMRENGKIYVVIGVIAVIFLSIVVFLLFIERRLAKLEKKIGTSENKDSK
jgi:hypothetical protein